MALQQQRSFAEKAVAAEVDWDAIGEMVQTDEGKRELAALRATYVDVRDKLDSMAKVGGRGERVERAGEGRRAPVNARAAAHAGEAGSARGL